MSSMSIKGGGGTAAYGCLHQQKHNTSMEERETVATKRIPEWESIDLRGKPPTHLMLGILVKGQMFTAWFTLNKILLQRRQPWPRVKVPEL